MSYLNKRVAAFVECALILVTPCAGALALNQSSKTSAAPEAPYVGTWKAKYKDKTVVILNLKTEKQKLAGSISIAERINVDRNGDISEVAGDPGEPRPIYDVRASGNILTFKSKDGDDVDQFEMKLTGEKSAELKYVITEAPPQGLQPPKPFNMIKQ